MCVCVYDKSMTAYSCIVSILTQNTILDLLSCVFKLYLMADTG